MKANLISIILLFCSFHLKAQTVAPEVFATAGTYFSSASHSLAWTIGEPFSETYSSTNNFLTQGFHQPQADGIGVEEHLSPSSIIAYPNPLIDDLNLYFGKTEGDFLVSIYDFSGKLVFSETIEASHLPGKSYRISFSRFSAGPYHLQLINSEQQLKSTYTIIKQ
jgi:hypothetical protein